jgi:hypothetical protein
LHNPLSQISGFTEDSSNLESTNSFLVLNKLDLVTGANFETRLDQASLASPSGISSYLTSQSQLISSSAYAKSLFCMNSSCPFVPFAGATSIPAFARNVTLHLSQSYFSPENPEIFNCMSISALFRVRTF